jgi:hypothetical protein
MITKFKKFNESSDWGTSWSEIKRLNAEIDQLKSEIKKKEKEIDSINRSSRNVTLHNPEELIAELKKYGVTEFILSDNEVKVPRDGHRSWEADYFEFINPNGVRIGVTFEFAEYSSDMYAAAITNNGKRVHITKSPIGFEGVKSFATKLIEITPDWIKYKRGY